MADPRFFKKAGPFTLEQLAKIGECALGAGVDPSKKIDDVKGVAEASSTEITWAFKTEVRDTLMKSAAGACITSPKFLEYIPQGMPVLISDNPHRSYGLIAQAFYPRTFKPFISDRASVDPTATLGEGCRVEPGAFIGANVKLGKNCHIKANAVVDEGVQMGDDCIVGSNAYVGYCVAGNKVYIYPGATVGQDGFGFEMDARGPVRVPQLGRVIIGDDVEIGANTTVDRGAMGDTEIGSGSRIDNLVQIAHNVKLGRCCIMVSQVGIAGSCTFGDFVVAGGQVGFAGHMNVGTGAKIGAQSGLMKDVPPGAFMMGTPAMPHLDWMRLNVILQKMVKDSKKEGK